ncbi:MAG: hypothetical protein M1839_004152 [Geoglossum umbratile]|nr:MAG: hypothetical protein M1839_004152 [Geoglossum umbratile]
MLSRIGLVAAVVAALLGPVRADNDDDHRYKYVALFSIDGLHGSDVEKYVAMRPGSTIASLLKTGYEYTNAYCPGPSDSFPGTLAQVTGATPRTTGVWYDDIWDRIAYDESIDFDSTELFSGGINPANLPKAKIDGKCVPLYPHMRLRVNTVWEILTSKGLETAYTDKHPAYDLVRGPSGKGLTQGYFPEIAAVPVTVDDTIGYDKIHVSAFLDWINGGTPANYEGAKLSGIPTMFGGNFQAVSVGQKTTGYVAAPGFPFTDPLLKAYDFVDASLGQVVDALKAKKIYDDTLIIIADKTDLKIKNVISDGALVSRFGNPITDPAVPDIIVAPVPGIIYTTSTSKIAEHGGIGEEDRHVACFVSNPGLKKKTFSQRIRTKQIAPTILKALGLNPRDLKGVVAERTDLLPGF